MRIVDFDLKLVHMARYELILRQVRAVWLRIIFKPLLTLQKAVKDKKSKRIKIIFKLSRLQYGRKSIGVGGSLLHAPLPTVY